MQFKNFLISEKNSLFDVLKKININGSGFVLVKSKKNRILGILTDGDLRRLVLNKTDLKKNCKKFINKDFTYIKEKEIKSERIKFLKNKKIKQIPILNENMVLKDILLNERLANFEKKLKRSNNTVVILAGGRGKRMLPLTKKIPKPMLKVYDKPMIENVIDKFKECGFNNFIISTNFLSSKIEDYFKNGAKKNININYIKEKKYLGTAGCLSLLDKKKSYQRLFCCKF